MRPRVPANRRGKNPSVVPPAPPVQRSQRYEFTKFKKKNSKKLSNYKSLEVYVTISQKKFELHNFRQEKWQEAEWTKNLRTDSVDTLYEGVRTNIQTICSWIELKNVVCVCPLGSLPLCHRHCQDKENEKVNVLSICRSFLLSREFQNLKIHMGVFSHHFPGRLNFKGPKFWKYLTYFFAMIGFWLFL